MKKFKLIALSLLASTFGLASCELPAAVKKIIPWADKEKEEQKDEEQESKGEVLSVKIKNEVSKITDETEPFKLIAHVEVKDNASKEVTWSSSAEAVATVGADGLVTPKGGGSVTFTATSVADPSKKDSITIEVVVVPGVASVEISGKPDISYLHRSSSLTATVHGKGQYNTGVTWTSSNEEVAKVDDNGVVSYLSVGEVTITATSKFDKSKNAVVSLSVVDGGLHPELIAQGYTFTREYPETLVNTFAGLTVTPLALDDDGLYYKETESIPETEESYGQDGSFDMIFEYSDQNFEAVLASLEGYFYFYDQYDEFYGYIDETKTVEFDLNSAKLPDNEYALQLTAYHTSELYTGSSVTTEDTEWNEGVKADLEAYKLEIPFIALGEDYDGYYYESSGIYEISDYSVDYSKLEGYDEVLQAAGFDAVLDEDGDVAYFEKVVDDYSTLYLAYYFCQYGNSIAVQRELTELADYPAPGVNRFVESEIGSIYSVPEFEATSEDVTYTFDTALMDLSEEEDGSDVRNVASVAIYGITEEECTGFVASLISEGYELDQESTYDKYQGI